MLDTEIPCPICGDRKKIECVKCNGNGILKKRMGIFPLSCPDCEKTGKVDCICKNQNEIFSILYNHKEYDKKQVETVVSFFINFENEFTIKFLETFLAKKVSTANAPLIFEILKAFDWKPDDSKNDNIKGMYALVHQDDNYIINNQEQITWYFDSYLYDYKNIEKNRYILTICMKLTTQQSYNAIENILTKTDWKSYSDIHNDIILFLLHTDDGLKRLTNIFEEKGTEYISYCLHNIHDRRILKPVGALAFTMKTTRSKKIDIDILKLFMEYCGLNPYDEAKNIEEKISENNWSHICSFFCKAAEVMIPFENEIKNLVDFIICNSIFMAESEKGLLKILSASGDGGEMLLKCLDNKYTSYDVCLRVFSYLEFIAVFHKNKFSDNSLQAIMNLSDKEIKEGGLKSMYQPGAFGGTSYYHDPENSYTICFDSLKKILSS